MRRSTTLALVWLLVGCLPQDEDKREVPIELTGYVYQADGAPAAGQTVFVEYPVCSGFFCWDPDRIARKTAKVSAKGFYTLRLPEGWSGDEETVVVEWPENHTRVAVTLQLKAAKIQLPDLRQWSAEPKVESFTRGITDYVAVSWKPMPSAMGISPESEYWDAFIWVTPILSDTFEPLSVWRAANGVSVPTELLSDLKVSYYEANVTQRVGEMQVEWRGGKVNATELATRSVLDLDCSSLEASGEENDNGWASDGSFQFPLTDVTRVTCQFYEPATISTVGWYGANVGPAGTGLQVIFAPYDDTHDVDIYLFDTLDLPDEAQWGAPDAVGKSGYGYAVLPAPQVARWLVVAPKDRELVFQRLTEVRAW